MQSEIISYVGKTVREFKKNNPDVQVRVLTKDSLYTQDYCPERANLVVEHWKIVRVWYG